MADDDVRSILIQFLSDNELPPSLINFITEALAANKPYSQIVSELRQTPEYKAAYPENDMRQANGLAAMSEAEIRAYRTEVRRLTQEYLGIQVSNTEIAEAIGKGYSARYWEHKLQVAVDMDRWGPTVKQVLASELGYEPGDDIVARFLDDEIASPELDRAYENALFRGQPAQLGFGVRPQEEADLLRAYGISPEKAFAGYQGIAAELPRQDRLRFIEKEMGKMEGQFPGAAEALADTSFDELFRGLQLGDPTALLAMQQRMAREVARFQGQQGGAARGRAGESSGLLKRGEL